LGSDWVDDLGTWDTLAIFHSSGKTPRLIDILTSFVFVTAGVILRAVSFSILVEISSWPLDLVVSMVESISNTSFSVAKHQWLWKPTGVC